MRYTLEQLNYKTAAVILAAGTGSRMNMKATKQTLQICGKTVLKRTLEAFDKANTVSSITIVCREEEYDFAIRESNDINKPVNIVLGGNTRVQSAKNGFLSIPKDSSYVMIHDAARCLIKPSDIDKIAKDAYKYGAATASYSVSDTIKKCNSYGVIIKTVSRENLRFVQTPQVFDVNLYTKALEKASVNDILVTDDNMLLENIDVKIFCTDTSKTNIKITTSSDLELAEFIIGNEAES